MAADDRMTDDAITDLEGFHIRATAATSPAASDPGICGNGGRRAYFPARKATSDIWFTVAARTLIATSPASSAGRATSSSLRTFGFRNS